MIRNYSRLRGVSFRNYFRRYSNTHRPLAESSVDANSTTLSLTSSQQSNSPDFIFFNGANDEQRTAILRDAKLYTDFVNSHEESLLDQHTYQQLRRLRYEEEHWDEAIHRYREIEKSNWPPSCQVVIERMRSMMNTTDGRMLSSVHVLDLAQDGYIKPHIDSERYCGGVIAGISLLTDSVMRLVHKDQQQLVVDLLLKRYSLYILKGIARYEFTHEILPNDKSYFNGVHVPRTGRRLAVICRLLPGSDASDKRDE